MLASTIQFSKYGQEHQPRTTTYRADASNTRETTHPDQDTHTNGLVRAGPSHPSNCHQLNRDPRRNRSNPQRKQSSVSRARFLRTQQRASALHPSFAHVPRPPRWAVLARSRQIQA